MKNDLKEIYGFEARLATKSEISTLCVYLAKKKWEDHQKSKATLKVKTTKKEATDFIEKEKVIILKLIRDRVMVQEYKKFNASIFVLNYIQEHDKGTILTMTFRVLKTEMGMEKLESDDAIFNLKTLKKHAYHKTRSRTGRYDRPKNESIQKRIEIRNYLKVNPDENRDRVCHEFGLSKTTYYRTTKWLEDRGK